MKKLTSILFFIGLFSMGIMHAQESEWKELLQKPNEHVNKELTAEKALSTLLQNKPSKDVKNLGVWRHETHFVCEVELGGYHFHVADYLDGTKIVTCLDGSSKGLQGISFRGLLQAESKNVQWRGSYFIHLYPGGKVTSYAHRQIADLY